MEKLSISDYQKLNEWIKKIGLVKAMLLLEKKIADGDISEKQFAGYLYLQKLWSKEKEKDTYKQFDKR